MPTPKPGQIRCPTCHRPTPPAAFCTQCGAAIPASAQPRPRGMDRNELEERIRTRKPGDGGLRRGTPLDADERPTSSGGYVPFVPEPEDAMAVREEEPEALQPNVDRTPADFDWRRQDTSEPVPPAAGPPYQPPLQADEPIVRPPYDVAPAEVYEQAAAPDDDAPYGAPEDAYPYPYQDDGDDGRRRRTSALPILGFILLCVLALGVGALLANMLGGDGGIGQTSPTPSAEGSVEPSPEPTVEPTEVPSDGASATPEPEDGPVTFPDGAVLAIQPCGSGEYDEAALGHPERDACESDSTTIPGDEVWAFVVFDDASASDSLTITLRLGDETVNEQELVLGSVLDDCGAICGGLIYGSHYVDLPAGEYTVTLRRGGDFADSATFTLEG